MRPCELSASQPLRWKPRASRGNLQVVRDLSRAVTAMPILLVVVRTLAICCLTGTALCAQAPSRAEVLAAMKKASTFYTQQVSKEGGYHYTYTDDLSYGRSEHGDGLSQVETQREGTPRVGMALLEAYAATGDRFYLEAARRTAHALVQGQLCTGGWDYTIEFDPALRKKYPYRVEHDCASQAGAKPPTTLDDNVTQACLRLMMRVDRELAFKDAKIHEAALFALDQLMKAQYANGAWPQRYTAFDGPAAHQPRQASYPSTWSRKWPGEVYQGHYTFNDNAIADDIDLFLEAARIYGDQRYRATAEKGGGFILMAQMPEPQPAWAQQYDADMHPAWARLFEPPSVTGGESQGIIELLMVLYRETGERKYLDAAGPALAWLEKSVLPWPASPSEAWRRQRQGEPVMARFYELQTNRPLFITKGTQVQAKGLGSIRPDGYALSYSDESVIAHYGVLTSGARLKVLRKEYDELRAAGKPTPRPDRLHGLSPWNEKQDYQPKQPKPEVLRNLIASMDARGAWIEEGVIGRTNKVIQVTAARAMMLTINGKPIEINENDRIELYQGAQPPRSRIIRSTRFAGNLETLAAALQPTGEAR